MAERTLIDTGPIVAVLVKTETHHDWALRVWGELEPPLGTCEAVLSEAQFLVARFGGNPLLVLEFVQRGAVEVAFKVQNEINRLLQLQQTYKNVPMSLADACLVRMTEQVSRCRLVTTDSDFRFYRRNGRQQIPLLMPENC